MIISPLLKRLFYILFALNVLLLAVNIVIKKITDSPSSNEKKELSLSEIEVRFKRSLHNFNLDDKWIIKKKGNSNSAQYKIEVPKDLPIPLLLREISSSFDSAEAQIKIKETVLRSQTELKIFTDKVPKLTALFDYNPKINRRSAEIGFIINATTLDDELQKKLTNVPEKFLVLIIPSKETIGFIRKLRESGKEYAILLNDETKDLDFKLSPDYSKERLKVSVRSILANFNDAVCYFYDPSSELYSSSAYQMLKQELEKRKISLVDYKSIPVIEGENYKAQLKDLIHGFNQDERKIILISSEDYFNALPEIALFWKKGYKFINPSLVIKD